MGKGSSDVLICRPFIRFHIVFFGRRSGKVIQLKPTLSHSPLSEAPV